ncbi:TIGR03088 family PEP-CTERM/XrtA system glycosyltransferase [Sulfuriferula sp.]|uniref:TIGR03088 family PEP-CTERM/XrtA system glycosyltransferase n=1 Tax=Sulfuriferula sp. TaxID=2025307 RepID=UPI00273144D1|nr:TIGR03088 family PEP-CTERM/XrtA system glycosyltransferase [Sulfuriferula sp.]MDP2025310.1 TIGR03088 family PEP-CTERM/XrtA system glycosyltransferase [Sulfuriferula sp.]
MSAPLIVHVVHHFAVGGMENGMVNILNRLPAHKYRHAVVCLTDYTDYSQRIVAQPVPFYALHKQPGRDVSIYPKLWRTLRALRPALVHTRNLSALEGQFVAAAAGIRRRVHGEHGRDVFDLDGSNRKYNLLRRAARPLVGHYISVSRDLQNWLQTTVGVPASRITQIYSGVDNVQFHPRIAPRAGLPAGFAPDDALVFGSVGRMAEVKDYPTLVRAFLRLLELQPDARQRARLVIVGEGVARAPCLALLKEAGAGALAWLPGQRHDIAELMRAMDVFVLPSLGEGISNTILEAQASGLPVVATAVGGNVELVQDGSNGTLVRVGDVETMAQALLNYFNDPQMTARQGQAARQKIECKFSLDAMTQAYEQVYDQVLAG